VPVTVKHRIGIDKIEDYSFVRDFVGTVAEAGCETFIVHARNAVLKGLSPKENREIPPLKYDYVYRLKREFPGLTIVVNGGITSLEQISGHLKSVDGVMIGRAAYSDPWLLADEGKTRTDVARRMYECAKGVESLRHVTRHMLGLYHGMRRARLWRQMLSDSARLKANRAELILEALEAVETENQGRTTFSEMSENVVRP
ncbi:MAG TPA: tRNA-dihydrouridine synthase, partial [Steroidobacteraceae bacterium]